MTSTETSAARVAYWPWFLQSILPRSLIYLAKIMEAVRCGFPHQMGYWFNEARNPALHLRQHTIPAFSIPLTVSISFLLLKVYEKHFGLCALNKLIVGDDGGKERERKEKQLILDEENSIPDNRRQPQREPRLKKYVVLALQFYFYARTVRAFFNVGQAYKDHIMASSFAEAFVLLLSGTYIRRDLLLPCILAATGWLLLPLKELIPISVIVSIALALPCIVQVPGGNSMAAAEGSGVLLVVLGCDQYISHESWVRQARLLGNEAWPLIGQVCFSFSKIAVFTVLETIAEIGEIPIVARCKTLAKRLLAVKLPELLCELLRIAAVLLPMALFFVVSSFCCSCLGWRSTLFGLLAEPPSWKKGLLGGICYMTNLCVKLLYRSNFPNRVTRDPWTTLCQELRFCCNTSAWTIVGLSGLWLLLQVWLWSFAATESLLDMMSLSSGSSARLS